MDDCDGGWGLGWFFPALIVGRLLADAFEQAPRMAPPAWQPPAAPQARITPHATCPNCQGGLSGEFAYCPHCGQPTAPAACRYCGRAVKPEMNQCAHCGGPTRL